MNSSDYKRAADELRFLRVQLIVLRVAMGDAAPLFRYLRDAAGERSKRMGIIGDLPASFKPGGTVVRRGGEPTLLQGPERVLPDWTRTIISDPGDEQPTEYVRRRITSCRPPLITSAKSYHIHAS